MKLIPNLHAGIPLSAILLGQTVHGQNYSVMQLPNLPGWQSLLPNDLNDHGEATGIGFNGFGALDRAFYFDGVSTIDFTAALINSQPPGTFAATRGLRINELGHILFNLEIVGVGVFSYVWDGGNYVELTPTIPPGASAVASSFNNHGQVCGSYKLVIGGELTYTAFIWDQTTNATTIIDAPPPFSNIVAADISDTGYVTGHVRGTAFDGIPARAFLWSPREIAGDATITILQAIDPEDEISIGERVNNLGHAGAFTTYLSRRRNRAQHQPRHPLVG